MQYHLVSSKRFLFALALLSASAVSPVHANSFHTPETNTRLNVGSAPNPTPAYLRATRSSDYPPLSQTLNEQGKVGLKIMLTDQGTMTDVVVEQSSGFPRLDEAAVRYMKTHWQYQPADRDKPMPSAVQASVVFRLQ